MFKDTIASLKSASEARLNDIKSKVDGAESEVQSFDTLNTEIDAEVKAQVDAAYDEGYQKGASESGTPGGEFTLDELNAEIKAATDSLNAQLSDQAVRMEGMQADLSAAQEASTQSQARVTELEARIAELENVPNETDQIASLTAERDALKAAIQTEIDDSKTDTSRLEAAVAPVLG